MSGDPLVSRQHWLEQQFALSERVPLCYSSQYILAIEPEMSINSPSSRPFFNGMMIGFIINHNYNTYGKNKFCIHEALERQR